MNEHGIVAEQALFGYDDGHRLLESSTRLTTSEREKLLLLTDLAPGVSNLRADGYWTGMPIPETRRYALMRTWPAPEMPRPGCVWTHVLLLPFEFLQQALSFESLLRFFHRPSERPAASFYATAIEVEALELDTLRPDKDDDGLDNLDFTSCAYFQDCTGKPIISQSRLGRAALRIWSQQWPSLRCSFRFRTIGRATFGKSPLLNFDLALSEGRLVFQYKDNIAGLRRWDSVRVRLDLAADLSTDQPTDLRHFIRVYGEDLPVSAIWIPFLAWIRRAIEEVPEHVAETDTLLREIGDALPRTKDGLDLKTDILSFSANSLASLPKSTFLAVLEFLVLDPRAASYPPLQASLYDWVVEVWASEPNRLLELVQVALANENWSVVRPIVEALSHISDVDRLMTSVSNWPTVRTALVLSNPALLQWGGLSTLEPSELLGLLDSLEDGRLVTLGIVKRLIKSPSFEVANYLCKRFPTEVLKEVCVGRGRQGFSFQANEFILQRAGEMAPDILSEAFLTSLGSTSALYSFASMLGFINSRTIEVGPLPWARSLLSASNDMQESEAHVLRSFLLALALARPQPGSEYIFEYSFDPLHRAMRDSALPYQASIILEPQLPDVSWWRRWDSCHRLRTAVVQAFEHADLDPSSFLRLSPDVGLMSQLFEILESDYHARNYLAKVRRVLDSQFAKRT